MSKKYFYDFSKKEFQKLKKSSLWNLSRFHSSNNPLMHTLYHIRTEFKKHSIPYIVVGGMAVYKYGYLRSTTDVDIIVNESDFEKFESIYKNSQIFDYRLKSRDTFAFINRLSRYKWIDKRNSVPIDLISTNENTETIVPFPDPSTGFIDPESKINYIRLHDLISIKLGAYLESGIKRSKDYADVVELIKANDLSIDLVQLLDPKVRELYSEIIVNLRTSKSRFE